MSEKSKFNVSVAPLWENGYGGFQSIVVDDKVFDILQGVEKGGKFYVRKLKPESRSKDNSPHAYLEYADKEKVAADKEKFAAAKAKEQSNSL